jgi:hypothetical protein
MSELTETEAELEQSFAEGRTHLQGFLWWDYLRIAHCTLHIAHCTLHCRWDYQYLRPFFIRKFTQQELKDGKMHVTELTDKWFQVMHNNNNNNNTNNNNNAMCAALQYNAASS